MKNLFTHKELVQGSSEGNAIEKHTVQNDLLEKKIY